MAAEECTKEIALITIGCRKPFGRNIVINPPAGNTDIIKDSRTMALFLVGQLMSMGIRKLGFEAVFSPLYSHQYMRVFHRHWTWGSEPTRKDVTVSS
jgi:hypothetical protein